MTAISHPPINWETRPYKRCFMACPPNRWCECRARMDYELRTKQGLRSQELLDQENNNG